MTAPNGFSFPEGFPFADGGAGHDVLARRLNVNDVDQHGFSVFDKSRKLAAVNLANTASFRIQTTDPSVISTTQNQLTAGFTAMMLTMQITTALNMQMFHPTAPLPMGDLSTLTNIVNAAVPNIGSPSLRFSGATTGPTTTTSTTTKQAGPTEAPSTTFYEMELVLSLPVDVDLVLGQIPIAALANALAEGTSRTCCGAVASHFNSAEECQVGQGWMEAEIFLSSLD